MKNIVKRASPPNARRCAFTGYRPQKMPFGFDETDPRCIDFKKRVRATHRKCRSARLYLETHSRLSTAMNLYEKLGFRPIERPEAVVHGTMDHFYVKKL